MDKIKVIVVDDSALMRKLISDMINFEEDMEVVDIARNGEELLKKLKSVTPDIITLDVEMPKLNGIETLKEIKKEKINIPVLMVSSVSKTSVELTMESLHYGAFDFICKPSGSISLDIDKVKDEIVGKIRVAFYSENDGMNKKNKIITSKIKTKYKHDLLHRSRSNLMEKNIKAVVIGASTGGPKALNKVVENLPKEIGVPVFIVQHMPVGFTKAFANRLNLNSEIKVVEAEDEMKIQNNVVYIAPGGYHMEIGSHGKIHLNTEPTLWGVRPAVDKLFKSASGVYKSHLLSVVLTGMGKDGAEGTMEVKKNNGITLAEDESTCVIYGMPKAAFETGMIDYVIPLDDVARNITKILLRS